MNLPAEAATALQIFQDASGWEQRARLLMQWGERLPPLSDEDKCEANLVHGCESQVWLVGQLHDGHWQFLRQQRCAVDPWAGGVAVGAGQRIVR
nr:hypothetical protein GCM10020185_16870 [Pseudomonas brassicacearum subsp. brassicacearum]